MPRLPRLKATDVIAAFERAGFTEKKSGGSSHRVLRRDGCQYNLSIPHHASQTLGAGLLRKLIRSAGMTVEEFIELLD
jgi:predicted RNA binding protein YcfA (HicA-like mRNA interferase family)